MEVVVVVGTFVGGFGGRKWLSFCGFMGRKCSFVWERQFELVPAFRFLCCCFEGLGLGDVGRISACSVPVLGPVSQDVFQVPEPSRFSRMPRQTELLIHQPSRLNVNFGKFRLSSSNNRQKNSEYTNAPAGSSI